MRAFYRFSKRSFDIVFALAALAAGSPLFLIISLRIRRFSPGAPVFFKHTRLGLHGKEFECWKFRSMQPNADQTLAALLNGDHDLAEEYHQTFKLKNDPRIIPHIGSFLRRTSLDELPQLINILRGEMSVVGPRPIVHDELAFYGEHAHDLLSVKPGLTGLWQVSGRNDMTYHRRVAIDLLYVRKASVILDLWILVRTIPLLFFRSNGY